MNNQPINEPNVQQGSQIIWTIIAAVIITAIIVGAGVWWWQKASFEKERQELQEQIDDLRGEISGVEEDEFKDWKTYRNEEYGFEVMYPGNWSVEEDDPSYSCQHNPLYSCLYYIKILPPSYEKYSWVDIDVFSNPNKYSTITWLENYMPDYDDIQSRSIDRDFSIAGTNGVKFTKTNGAFVPSVFADNNENMFSITTHYGQGQKETEQIFNHLLSTFKFIE